MLTIGLTGPTGAGKTTVLKALGELGCARVDCDALYHRLLDTSQPLREELTQRFGKSILDSRGKVDTRLLGDVVFQDPQALEDLNAIAHRHVAAACISLIRTAKAQGKKGLALDAIALIESGLGALCDVTVAVIAPENIRLERIMARDDISRDRALQRMSAQKPNEYYVNHCDHTIVNDGSRSFQELKEEVARLLANKLCQPSKGGYPYGRDQIPG